MKIETLKKSHLKRNIIIGVGVVFIISAVVLNFTKAKYRVAQSIPLVNGTINYSLADLNAVAIYINGDSGYTKTDTIPDGYVLNESESYCTVNGEEDTNISLSYDTATKSLSVTPMTTRGTKCYLYFDTKPITIQDIIASKNLATRTDFRTTITEDTTGTIYYADTSKGRTYYFAGNPTDNWVKFAGFYWRIIRINEDGTLRLIYQGTSANTTGEGTEILQGVSFNNSRNNNAYVGFKYTIGSVHGTETNSSILIRLNNWYTGNLSNYTDDIDGNAGFCGDRTPSTSKNSINNSGGIGTTETYYGGYVRYYGDTSMTPTFDCDTEDLYTTSGSVDGNRSLTYPIGLISMDEVWYAGGLDSYNMDYYLYTGENYWTMTPNRYNEYLEEAYVFCVLVRGQLGYVYGSWGVRPVINLKVDTQFSSGDGTATNPYVVS